MHVHTCVHTHVCNCMSVYVHVMHVHELRGYVCWYLCTCVCSSMRIYTGVCVGLYVGEYVH